MKHHAILLGLCAAMTVGCASAAGPTSRPVQPAAFTNPIRAHGADPWLEYVDGWYYLATTNGRDVKLRRARHFADLKNARDEVVLHETVPERAHRVWAPEFHQLDDGTGKRRWYVYYTANDGDIDDRQRMYVAQSTTDDIRGPYAFKGKLNTDPADKFYAIDGTVFEGFKGEHYFAWCGRPSKTGQGLFLARMINPWTLAEGRVSLAADGFGCPVVREGPVALRHEGKLFLIYSMCPASTPDYRLGMLVADASADLVDPKAWKQYPKVVFARDDAAGVYGPGHNYFFKSPDGTEDWIVYHAKTSTKDTYADRTTRAQKFVWNADGTPDFGTPVKEGVELAPPSGE